MVELTEQGFDRFSVQRVLEAAEVSRGTLYHHFPDVETLIEAALVETFSQELLANQALVRDLMERSHDRASFREGLRAVANVVGAIPAVVRLRRTHTIALSDTRPNLAAAIAEVQDRTTDAWTDTVREAQRRGFARPELDARSTAVMIQAMTLGRIIDDAASEQIGNDAWSEIYFEFIDHAVLVSDTRTARRSADS